MYTMQAFIVHREPWSTPPEDIEGLLSYDNPEGLQIQNLHCKAMKTLEGNVGSYFYDLTVDKDLPSNLQKALI